MAGVPVHWRPCALAASQQRQNPSSVSVAARLRAPPEFCAGSPVGSKVPAVLRVDGGTLRWLDRRRPCALASLFTGGISTADGAIRSASSLMVMGTVSPHQAATKRGHRPAARARPTLTLLACAAIRIHGHRHTGNKWSAVLNRASANDGSRTMTSASRCRSAENSTARRRSGATHSEF
eukprot:scaffold13303_cov70-Phaeocystis_antarctica.AAC.8